MSKVVRDAYEHYGDMEFGKKNRSTYKIDNSEEKTTGISIDNDNRHIKLISIAGKGVLFLCLCPVYINIHFVFAQTQTHSGGNAFRCLACI